jgi:hypothetical protein
MKKLGSKKLALVILLLAMTAISWTTAVAQDTDSYFTTYYSNANTVGAPDATLRIINDGFTENTLYADIYVFDDSEELTECCSCPVTPDGLLAESVNLNLTANPLTSIKPTRGVIKVISSSLPGAGSDGNGMTGVAPSPGLHAWATRVQGPSTAFSLTETPLADANLATSERILLEELCHFDGLFGGKPCICTPEDMEF